MFLRSSGYRSEVPQLTNTYRPERHTLRFVPSILHSIFTSRAGIRLLLVALALPLVSFFLSNQTGARTSTASACECNRNAPDVISARWMPNSTLRVMLRRGDFSREEVAAFQESIRLWQAVLPQSGTGIDLRMGGEIADNNCTNCIIVKRKAQMGGTFAALMLLSTQGRLYKKAAINIKSDVHKPVLLRMLLTHELGHAFGLDDCEECGSDTTVMNSVNKYAFGKFSFFAPRNKMAAKPTSCDIARVTAGYAGATQRQALAGPNAQTVKPQQRLQTQSVSLPTSSTPVAKPTAAASAQQSSTSHHASRSGVQSQRAVRIEQLVLMDALARRDR